MRSSPFARTIPLWMALSPAAVIAQAQAPAGSRPHISVIIAFAVSWLMIAAWMARIGWKVNRLLERSESRTEGSRSSEPRR